MRRVNIFGLFLFLITAGSLSADGMAGPGIETSLTWNATEERAPKFLLGGTGEFIYSAYAFPTKELALYLDTGGILTYWFQPRVLQTRASIAGELSFRRGQILLSPAVKSRINALFPAAGGDPSTFQSENLISLLFSYGNTEREFRLQPRFHLNMGENFSFGPGGELGFTFGLSPATFMDTAVSGNYLFLPNREYLFSLTPSLGITSYPSYSVSTTTEVWYHRNLSSRLTVLGGYSVPLPGETYHEIGISEELLLSLSPEVNISFFVPGTLLLKDHPAVSGGALLGENEYLFQLNPEISLHGDMGKSLLLEISLSGSLPFSNSDYRRNPGLAASAVLFFTF